MGWAALFADPCRVLYSQLEIFFFLMFPFLLSTTSGALGPKSIL